MNVSRTYLAPGQRYTQVGGTGWRLDQQVTIARLDRDRYGVPRVTFRCHDGREVVTYAAQVEAAVAEGHLAPIVAAGATGHFC